MTVQFFDLGAGRIIQVLVSVFDASGDPANGADSSSPLEFTVASQQTEFDLGVDKLLLTAGPYEAGDILTYRIAVTNFSDKTQRAELLDFLPDGTRFKPADFERDPRSDTDWDCTTIPCTILVTIPANDFTPVVLEVEIFQPPANLLLLNRAEIVAAGDTNASNDISETSHEFGHPDLVITKTTDDEATPGGLLHYRIIVRNDGTRAVDDVDIADIVPEGTTFVARDAFGESGTPDGSDQGWSCDNDAPPGTVCTISTNHDSKTDGHNNNNNSALDGLAPGSFVSIDFVVRIGDTLPADIVNSATVPVPPGDRTPKNNQATHRFGRVDLVVEKVALRDQVLPGEGLRFRITVTNEGVETAESVTLVETFPSLLELRPGENEGWGGCIPIGAGDLTCGMDLGSMPPGDSRTIDVVLREGPDGVAFSHLNHARASSTSSESNLENNEDTARVLVAAADGLSDGLEGRLTDDWVLPGSGRSSSSFITGGGTTPQNIIPRDRGVSPSDTSDCEIEEGLIVTTPLGGLDCRDFGFTPGDPGCEDDPRDDTRCEPSTPAPNGSDGSGDGCTPCIPGTFVPGGSDGSESVCTPCTPGTLSSINGATVICPPPPARGAITEFTIRDQNNLDTQGTLRAAQDGPQLLSAPLFVTRNLGPLNADPAGLQWYRLEADGWAALPTRVDYVNGSASFSADTTGRYVLFICVVRDIPLPAGTAALGFHGAPGTSPDLLQGQLEDPAALQALFQFRNGAWTSFRPGGLAILNSLTSIDANAPLFLILSRATRWAGPINPAGDRDVPIASGFTSLSDTGADGIAPGQLVGQFGSPGGVVVIFAFDNALTEGQGGYRTFRTTGPAFLNDLEALARFDVLFVLTDGATQLSLPGG